MNALTGYIHLDFRSQEPIYQQIVRQVEAMVREGALKPGDQLPTVRQMATDLRINFSTVARAYHILDEKKLISTQRGRGTYIWEEGSGAAPPGDAPLPETEPSDRSRRVQTMVRDFLDQAARQGFTPEEIQAALDIEITARFTGSGE